MKRETRPNEEVIRNPSFQVKGACSQHQNISDTSQKELFEQTKFL